MSDAPQEEKGWRNPNRSACCGAIKLFYGPLYKSYCSKCGRDCK